MGEGVRAIQDNQKGSDGDALHSKCKKTTYLLVAVLLAKGKYYMCGLGLLPFSGLVCDLLSRKCHTVGT